MNDRWVVLERDGVSTEVEVLRSGLALGLAVAHALDRRKKVRRAIEALGG